MKRPLCLALCVVLALFCSACNFWGDGAAPQLAAPIGESAPQPLTAAPQEKAPSVPGLPASEGEFNPLEKDNLLNSRLTFFIFEPLFYVDATFSPSPCLASYAGGDGFTLTLTIDIGRTFSDGTPLTASIAADSLRLAQQSKDGAFAARLQGLTFSAQDSATLVITSQESNRLLPYLLDIPIALKKGSALLGTGPYVLTEDENGRTLTARDPQAPVSEIALFNADEETRLYYDFDARSISAMLLSSAQYTAGKTFTGSKAVPVNTTRLCYIGVNTSRGILADPAARQGLYYAFDKKDLCTRVFSQYAVPAGTIFHPKSAMFGQLTEQGSIDVNPDLARQRLGEAGLADVDQDGRLEIANTRRKAALTILVSQEEQSRKQLADIVATRLESFGITAKIACVDGDEYRKRIAELNYDLYIGEVRLDPSFCPDRFDSMTGTDSDAFIEACAFYRQSDGNTALAANASHLVSVMLSECKIIPIGFVCDALVTRENTFASFPLGVTDVYSKIMPHWTQSV